MQQSQPSVIQAKDLYFSLMKERLDQQIKDIEALDNKLAAIFGFSNVTAGIFAALVTTGSPDFSKATLAFLVVIATSYVCAGFFAYRAYQISEWSERPNWDNFKQYSQNYPDEAMKEWVGDECYESLKSNAPKVKKKADRLWWALTFTATQALGMLGAAATVVVN